MLEAETQPYALFVTLTYSKEHLPEKGTLVPRHPQLWLKRIRRKTGKRLRYFLVGEYGDTTWRPHYHVMLFGLDAKFCIECEYQFKRDKNKWCDCLIYKTWTFGQCFIGDVTPASAQYVAGYVTKKLTNIKSVEVKEILAGRHPEFARMSTHPGIGALAIKEIAKAVNTPAGAQGVLNNGDVPWQLQRGKKQYPLGRYLIDKLRQESGYDKEMLKRENLEAHKEEVETLVQGKIALLKQKGKIVYDDSLMVKSIIVDEGAQAALNQKVRINIRKKERGI